MMKTLEFWTGFALGGWFALMVQSAVFWLWTRRQARRLKETNDVYPCGNDVDSFLADDQAIPNLLRKQAELWK